MDCISSSVKARSTSWRTTPRVASRRSTVLAEPGTARAVTTTSSRVSATLSAMYSRTASESGSAHCRSSTTRIAGTRPAAASSSRMMPSARTIGDVSNGLGAVGQNGKTRLRAGRNGSRSASAGVGAARRPLSNASVRGRNAGGDPSSTQRPMNTAASSRAHLVKSSTSRDFPIPAGPITPTAAPRPTTVAANEACRASHSASRPTITGHRRTGTVAVSTARRRGSSAP